MILTDGTCYDIKTSTVTHRISIAILGIYFCSMRDQQVDDFTVAVPCCQHQAGHLRPVKDNQQKSTDKMKITDNKREANEEKTKQKS